MHEAKTQLSKLVDRAERGYEVVIARNGKPVVRLVPVTPPSGRRPIGRDKGRIWMSSDFDEPLPESVFPGDLS